MAGKHRSSTPLARRLAARARARLSGRRLAVPRGRDRWGLAMLLVFAVLATLPPVMLLVSDSAWQRELDGHQAMVSQATQAERDAQLAAARDYNAALFADGRRSYGEYTDPATGRTARSGDKTYLAQLNVPGDGIMATVDYPRLGISLPVRHGTSDHELTQGAGHVYGTSLPVGGADTHSIISAHTGLADRLMFDKLSLRQGRVGDTFYIGVMGQTLAYMVESITVIDPDDFSLFTVHAGRDRVSLLTCTPYGVNTKRLLVTGVRVGMPDPAPAPGDVARAFDWTRVMLVVWIALVWTLVALAVARRVWPRRKPAPALTATHDTTAATDTGTATITDTDTTTDIDTDTGPDADTDAGDTTAPARKE